MIARDIEGVKRDLDDVKDISIAVGDVKQLDAIRFLQH
jgi:hypothetical protein